MNFSPLILLGPSLALLLCGLSSVGATCHCQEVCPSYTDLWVISSDCPANGIQRCVQSHINRGGLLVCDRYEKAPEGGCACNVFGCNCDGCGCSSPAAVIGGLRGLRQKQTVVFTPPPIPGDDVDDACADYDYYAGLSDEERSAHLFDKHCSGNTAITALESPFAGDGTLLRTVLEDLADTNRDGALDCLEFNAATFDFDASVLCGANR